MKKHLVAKSLADSGDNAFSIEVREVRGKIASSLSDQIGELLDLKGRQQRVFGRGRISLVRNRVRTDRCRGFAKHKSLTFVPGSPRSRMGLSRQFISEIGVFRKLGVVLVIEKCRRREPRSVGLGRLIADIARDRRRSTHVGRAFGRVLTPGIYGDEAAGAVK